MTTSFGLRSPSFLISQIVYLTPLRAAASADAQHQAQRLSPPPPLPTARTYSTVRLTINYTAAVAMRVLHPGRTLGPLVKPSARPASC